MEWDIWEPQRLKESKAFALGWDTCSSSIFTPCLPKDYWKDDEPTEGPPAYMELSLGDSHHTVPGSISKYDYFLDLVDTTAEQKHVGQTVSSLLMNRTRFSALEDLQGSLETSNLDLDDEDEEDVTPAGFGDMYEDFEKELASSRSHSKKSGSGSNKPAPRAHRKRGDSVGKN